MRHTRTTTLSLLITLTLLLAIPLGATTRRVGSGEPYHTITAAHTAAANGDTILVAADSYTENLTLTKSLVILGAGFGTSGSSRINGYVAFNAGSGGSTLEGFHLVHGGSNISLGTVTNITIRRVRMEQTYAYGDHNITRSSAYAGKLTVSECCFKNISIYASRGCLTMNTDSVYVYNSIFGPTGASPCFLGTAGSLVVENCAFLNVDTVFGTTGWFPLLMANNIFHDWRASATGLGSYPTLGTWEYNASSATYPAPGVGALVLAANPFVDYVDANNFVFGTSDLHLDPVNGAPCIDSGQPAQVDVLDGSPCDRGIYGSRHPFIDSGAPNYPFVTSLTVPGAVVAGQPLPISATGRIGREE